MLNILVVDDSRIARKRLIDTIESLEIEHTILGQAVDGVDALRQIKEHRPNLLITDIEMPNMDGIELLNTVRKLGLDMSVITISTMANEQVKQIIHSDKYSDFMPKPIKPKVLEMLLQKVLLTISNRSPK